MDFNLVEIITFLGAMQGLGLASILFFSSKHASLANRILAIFITLFSLHIVREITQSHGFLDNLPILATVSLTFTGYYAPLLFLYVITLIKEETQLQLKHASHFIVAGLITFAFTIAALNGLTDWSHLKQYQWLEILVSMLQLLMVLQIFVYLYLCFRRLKEYRAWLRHRLSTIDELGYLWLTRLLSGFSFLIFTWVGVFGADIRILEIKHHAWIFDLFWLAISLFVYWIGYYSILKPEILTEQFKRESTRRSSDVLDEATIRHLKSKLESLFEQEKVYLDPDLTLKQLARKLNLNEKKLTQVLNLGFGRTFYNLINHFRVEEVKRCLMQPQNADAKLEVLAYEAGFKSASTFNRQFKSFAKMTPKAFREKQTAKPTT